MTKLCVRLLGGYQVELDGEALYDFRTDKARALLAYLVVEADRPHRRETLAGLLWPDCPDSVARANLRQALWGVRRALCEADHEPPFFLFVTSTDVQFNTASDYTLDVAELRAFAHARQPQLLPEAFCADFLAGFSIPGSEAFEAWVLNKQEQYHRLALEILDEQNAYFEGHGDYGRAVEAARRQLRLEPWLEEAHRRCMRGLALAGRRDEALRQYELCRQALQTELGLEPEAGTQALYAGIRAGRPVAAARPSPVGRPVALAAPGPAGPPGTLVARQDELGQLGRHLQAALAGQTGVAFVSGDAGSGKTALLEAFAASAMAEHPDLLVAGARCSPGDHLNPCAPLRKLAEMLFGDLAGGLAWRLANLPGASREQADRLQRASDLVLASLAEHGLGLVETLVPAASVARRAGLLFHGRAMSRSPVSDRFAWLAALEEHAQPSAPPAQDVLFGQLLCTLAALARQQPLLLLLDDLHWVDDASAAFLLRLGRELAGGQILVLGAYRSATVALGRRDPRSGEVTRHPLAPVVNELRRLRGEIVVDLDRADGRGFVEAYVDTETNRLGAPFRDALYAQTGGHALFTVETLRVLQERGELAKDEAGRWVARESLDWGALPARVEAAIAERIEHLPDSCRRILSCASVQGDDFAGEMAAELAGMPAGAVIACLSGAIARQHHLVRPEGLQRLGSQQQSVYRFTHHLFQRYLYDQLDPVERAQLHGGVAAALDRHVGDDLAERARCGARLAWHYEAAGLPLQAARALLDAGHEAMRVSAFRQALDRYDHGLALLVAQAPSEERREIARLLEVARLGPLRNLEGTASDRLQGALARAAAAWAAAPEGAAQGRAQLLLLAAEMERLVALGQFENALAAAERMRAAATTRAEEELAGLARFYAGFVHHLMGDPRLSEQHLAWVLGWLTSERRARLRAALGMDLLANSLAFAALNRWLLGCPEQALARSRQAVAAARAEGSPVGEAASAALGAKLLFLLRVDEGAMAELSEACRRLSLQQGLAIWRVHPEVLLGRLMVVSGDDVAGIARIRGAGWQGSEIVMGTGFFVVVLADSCLLAAGRRARGNDAVRAGLLDTGLAAIEGLLPPRSTVGTGVGPAGISCGQCYEAEMRRLRGELLLARDGLAAAEEALACFTKSLRLGQEQGALAWELRAASSLVSLRQRQAAAGAPCAAEWAEARARLREIYARFTEGFAFPDLQDAAALLGETG